MIAKVEYAINAFAVAATDYVVKPFSPERLLEATDRALIRMREHRWYSRMSNYCRCWARQCPRLLSLLTSHKRCVYWCLSARAAL